MRLSAFECVCVSTAAAVRQGGQKQSLLGPSRPPGADILTLTASRRFLPSVGGVDEKVLSVTTKIERRHHFLLGQREMRWFNFISVP